GSALDRATKRCERAARGKAQPQAPCRLPLCRTIAQPSTMTLALPDCAEPELSVVMVTHGRWPLTERAIAALVANTRPCFELIVVDNASPDETRAEHAQHRVAEVIGNDRNVGFGPATNQGAQRARGEYLLLLN